MNQGRFRRPRRLRQLRFLIPLLLLATSLVTTTVMTVVHVRSEHALRLENLKEDRQSELFRMQNSMADLLEIRRLDLAERRIMEAALEPTLEHLALVDQGGTVVLSASPEWKGRPAADLPGFDGNLSVEAGRGRKPLLRQTAATRLQGVIPLPPPPTSSRLRSEIPWTLLVTWDLSRPMAEIRHQALDEALEGLMVNAGVALLLLGMLEVLVIRRLVHLQALMSQVGKGNLTVRAREWGQDEIARIGQVFNGMTARLRYQRAELLASEERLLQVLEHSPIPVAVFTEAGATEFLSRSFESTYGYTLADLPTADQWWAAAYPSPEERQEARARWDGLVSQARGPQVAIAPQEHRITCKDGTYRIVELQGTHIGPRVVVTLADLTPRIAAEEERRRMEADIQHAQKLESLGSLAGGISHDMNNVLAAILGMATTLRIRHGKDAALDKALEIIERAAHRGAEQVKGLRDFVRKDLQTMGPVDLNGLVKHHADLLRHTTLQRITVLVDLDPGLPKILGDASALGAVLMNLCVNAVDAMGQGGSLHLTTRREGTDRVQVEVRDTGPGIPAELQERIFDPYFTTKPPGKGTGLGLAMVASSVKSHHGTLSLHSLPGEGATFTLRFPAMGHTESTGEMPLHRPAPAQGDVRVLVVDDDELVRLSTVPMLVALGHQTLEADSVSQALERLTEGPQVDVVLMDHNMPAVTGAEGLRLIRDRWPALPVIMCSGHIDDFLRQALDSHPGVPFLTKPYSMAQLSACLAGILPKGFTDRPEPPQP